MLAGLRELHKSFILYYKCNIFALFYDIINMEDKIIQKLSTLKNITPRQDWVLLTRTDILSSTKQEVRTPAPAFDLGQVFSVLRYFERPAFVLPVVAFVVLGGAVMQVSNNSLPGDTLYSVRSAVEQTKLNLVSTEEKPLAYLALAQKRLQDLEKVAQENRVANLPESIREFNASVAEVSKGFSQLVEKEPGKALQASRELVQLQKDKARVEQILGAVIGEQENSEIQNSTRILVEAELTDLTERTLQEEQKELLIEAIMAYQKGDYENALEFIWRISN
jgi:uncharacterized protein YoxC